MNTFRSIRTRLVTWLPVVPAAAALSTAVLYLEDWPYPGNHGVQLAVGLGFAVPVWLALTLLGGGDLLAVETASAASYEELRGRVLRLQAQFERLATSGHDAAAVADARPLVEDLAADFVAVPAGSSRRGSPYRWLLGHGYVNAWRHVDAAEDLLLRAEAKQVVYATAVANEDRGTAPARSETALAHALAPLVHAGGADGDGTWSIGRSRRSTPVRRSWSAYEHEAIDLSDDEWVRRAVSDETAAIHKKQNDTWLQLVNLRNRLFQVLIVATVLIYAIVVLAVLRGASDVALIAAGAFFLVGAVVGVFNELYATSRRSRGIVFDYGLANVRALVTPVVSGIAAVGGVLITNYAGSFLVVGADAQVPPLGHVFSLQGYGMGIVVAAIFGLTPGLLLQRLRERTDAYKDEIEQLSAATPGKGG